MKEESRMRLVCKRKERIFVETLFPQPPLAYTALPELVMMALWAVGEDHFCHRRGMDLAGAEYANSCPSLDHREVYIAT